MLPTLIQRYDKKKKKNISFLIQVKNERLTEILHAVNATFYDRINTIYKFIKPFLKKNVYFWGIWSL